MEVGVWQAWKLGCVCVGGGGGAGGGVGGGGGGRVGGGGGGGGGMAGVEVGVLRWNNENEGN